MKITKAQRKDLRTLSETAHESELSQALSELHVKFHEWQNGNVSTWDINQEVHEFHDGKSRDLYKFYVMNNEPLFRVASALAKEVIGIDEVPENCRAILKPIMEIER